MEHYCGCVTKRIKSGVVISPCKLHKKGGVRHHKWIWIALQHKDCEKYKKSHNINVGGVKGK